MYYVHKSPDGRLNDTKGKKALTKEMCRSQQVPQAPTKDNIFTLVIASWSQL